VGDTCRQLLSEGLRFNVVVQCVSGCGDAMANSTYRYYSVGMPPVLQQYTDAGVEWPCTYSSQWQIPLCELLFCGLLSTRIVCSAPTRLTFMARPLSDIPGNKAGLACTRILSDRIR
jgi:hypothetical protein